MNTIREIQKINQEELDRGIAGTSASWHSQYSKSAWVYVGNLDHQLTEGDVISVMSQFGEVEDIHLVREEDTGKSKGFAFLKYEDTRSCVLAVDNFIGVQLLGRSMRVDHVEKYRLPKKILEEEEAKAANNNSLGPGHAYQGKELANEYNLDRGQDLFAPQQNNERSDKAKKEDPEERRRRKDEKRQKKLEKEERKRHRDERRQEREDRKRKKKRRDSDRHGDDDHSEGDGEDRDRRRRHHKKRRKHDKKDGDADDDSRRRDRKHSKKDRRE